MTRALLVIDRGSDGAEAMELAESAGYQVVEVLEARWMGGGKFGIPTGKVKEIGDESKALGVEAVIAYGHLKSSQAFNMTKDLGLRVVDREKLILEIFALRARTPESKLQVKLAELTYELPRLRELIRRVKMGEQPGLYGYGEYEVEKYYDHVRKMQGKIREDLEKYAVHRGVQREGRRRWNLPLISLAGHTGAGKTTLFNALAKERRPVTGRAFTTLTTTTRDFWLGGLDHALLTDTVGFLTGLPHYMIEAFRSTLEELRYADLVLLVIDVSEPMDVIMDKLETSEEILEEMSVRPDRILHVLNKADLLKGGMEEAAARGSKLGLEGFVAVSSRLRMGLDDLRARVTALLAPGAVAGAVAGAGPASPGSGGGQLSPSPSPSPAQVPGHGYGAS